MRLAADFPPDVQRGAGSGLLVRRRLMVDQPQAPRALQTGDVTRFGEVLASQSGNPGPSAIATNGKKQCSAARP